MDPISDKHVQQVMSRLPPEARTALHVMSEMQHREPEDVLRDEIKTYIEGRIPTIDLEGIVHKVKDSAYTAGYLVGSLRKFARSWNSRD